MGEVGREAPTLAKALAAAARLLREAGIATPELDARLLLCHAAWRQPGGLGRGSRARPCRRMRKAVMANGSGVVSRASPCRASSGAASSTAAPSSSMQTRSIRGPTPRRWWTRRSLWWTAGAGAGARSACSISARARAAFSSRCSPSCQGPPASAPISACRRCPSPRTNARRLGVDDRAQFIAGDWFEPVAGAFDLIVANPPYLATEEIDRLPREVAMHDPRLALDGGRTGSMPIGASCKAPQRGLRPGGAILLEIGPSQAERVLALLRGAGLQTPAGRAFGATSPGGRAS